MDINSFSDNASKFAVSELDGRIKFIESNTSKVLQELTPSGLNATCSCVAWQAAESADESKASKRRRSLSSSQVVALGCVDGTIIICDLTKSSTLSRLEGGHQDRVTCLRWHPRHRNVLFSAGQDGHIVEWDVSSSTMSNRWKADRSAVSAIDVFEGADSQVTENGNATGINSHDSHRTLWMISAASKVKVWNVDKQDSSLTLNTQRKNVQLMRLVTSQGSGNEHFIVIGSKQDRTVNVWRFNTTHLKQSSNKNKSDAQMIGTLKTTSETRTVDCVLLENALFVAVVTQSGDLLLYEHEVSSTNPWQCEATKTVRVMVTRKSKGTQCEIVNCALAADPSNAKSVTITLAYRTRLGHFVESVRYSELRNSSNVLEREERGVPGRFVSDADLFRLGAGAMTPPTSCANSTSSSLSSASDSSSVELVDPDRSLANDHTQTAPKATTEGGAERSRNRKRKGGDESDAKREHGKRRREEPLAEVKETEMETEKDNTTTLASEDPLVALLTALDSNNDTLFRSVVQSTKQAATIQHTVRQVPSTHLSKLMRELLKRLQQSPQSDTVITERSVRWLHEAISAHSNQFAVEPVAFRLLQTARKVLASRMHAYAGLLRLRGKLELVLDQVSKRNVTRPSDQDTVVFRDDSDAESDSNSNSDGDSADEESDDLNSHEQLFDEDELDRIAEMSDDEAEDQMDEELAGESDDNDD